MCNVFPGRGDRTTHVEVLDHIITNLERRPPKGTKVGGIATQSTCTLILHKVWTWENDDVLDSNLDECTIFYQIVCTSQN